MRKLVISAPIIFPNDPEVLQIPIRVPLLFFPYQLEKIVTTLGQPVDCKIPLIPNRKQNKYMECILKSTETPIIKVSTETNMKDTISIVLAFQ